MKILRNLHLISFKLKPTLMLAFLLPALFLIRCTSNGGSTAADTGGSSQGGSGGSGSNTPAGCVQTSSNPVANATSLGGNCVTPVLVDQGNGTAKDTANNLLWVRCTVSRDVSSNIVVRESAPGNCNATNAANVWYQVPGNTEAANICNGLVYAGRSDWVLPDLKQLSTYYNASAGSAPYSFGGSALYGTAFYNSPSQIYYITTTTGAGSTAGFVDFSRPTGSGGGAQIITNNTQGIVLCMVKL